MPVIGLDQLTNAPIPELWGGDPSRFWVRRAAGRAIDAQRTSALARVDIPMSVPAGTRWDGHTYGQPVQIAASPVRRFDVLDLREGWFPPWTWRQRAVFSAPDPAGTLQLEGGPFDRHWRCIEGTPPASVALWEVWHLQPGGFPFASWQASSWKRWDLSRSWVGQGAGVVAGGFPHTPLLVQWSDVDPAGPGLRHGCFIGLDTYSPERTGPAVNGDGDDPTHPCRSGEWLRLRADVANRIIATGSPIAAKFAEGLRDYGGYVGDRTWWKGQPDAQRIGIVQGTQDTRLAELGQLRLRLADFEVVVPA